MKTIRWAAVAVTGLFALMNLGATADTDLAGWVRVGAGLLAAAGAVAAAGWATDRPWGRTAVTVVGALNVAGAVTALVRDEAGGAVGLVLGGLAVALSVLAGQSGPLRAHA